MDNSFFRFIDNFDKAKDLYNNKFNEFDYDMQIHLKPSENYSCITNVVGGISFGDLYKAYIVNCSNEILTEITDNVYIEEFVSSIDGSTQMKFEVVGLAPNSDFYTDLVYLRLDHNIVGGKSYWSNPFLLSNYDIDETVRFRFKHYSNLDGTNYKIATILQSIRLKIIKNKNTFVSSSQSYTTFVGLKYSSRLIKTKMHEYTMDMCSDFIYDRLQYLLNHDIIYVDTIRVTDKQTFENTDKFGGTNITQVKFKVAIDESDIDNEATQVYIPPVPVINYDYSSLDYDGASGGNDYLTD